MSASKVIAGEAVVRLSIANRIKEGLAGAQRDLNDFGKSVTSIGAAFASSAGALLAGPIMAASRMQETVSKFNQVFGVSSAEVGDWAKTTSRAVGVTEESMLSMLASTKSLLTPMGLMPSQADEISKTLSQLSVDLGSFNNMNSADVFRDLMAAMTGESEPMKKYGVIVNETATKQELLNMGMDPRFANDAAKAQARFNIIMRSTTAAQGDAIRTSGSFANQMKALWSSVMDTSAALGMNLVQDLADFIKAGVSGVYFLRDFASRNAEVVRAVGATAVGVAGLGASLVAGGVAMRVASAGMGALAAASQVAGSVASVAWAGVTTAFTILTLKSRITAAVIRAGWSAAAAAIGIAWTALTGALSVAMQGLIAAATVTAIVSPWVAAAGTIAVAWFGLDAVMATLALGAAAAWSASAGTVTAAWSASAGVLIPLAGTIAGAYTASAAFVAGAWGTLSAAFASGGAMGVAAALASGAAWAGFGLITQALAIKQAIDAAIVSAAWSVAAGVASAAWTGFGVVLSMVTSPAAAMTAAASAVSTAWTVGAGVAAAAWEAAYALITAPLLPFIATAAAGVALMGGIAAAAMYAGAAGADFAKAWKIVTETFGQLVSVVNVTFSAIRDAMSAGDFAMATQALWAAIQAGFWIGVEGAIKAFKWFWREAWEGTKRMFSALLDFTWRVMKAIGRAIMNPFAAAREIGTAIGELIGGATNFEVSAQVKGSKEALKAIRDQAAAAKARNEAEKEAARIREANMSIDEKRAKRLKEIAELEKQGALSRADADKERQRLDQEMPLPPPMQAAKDKRKQIQEDLAANKITQWEADNRMQLVDQEEQAGKQKMRDSLKVQLELGEITPGEFEKQMAGIDGIKESYFDLVKGIETEILALEKGEQAADRKRMADEGLNEQQIKDIEALKAKKKALEEMKAAQDAAMAKRVDGIFGQAEQLGKDGLAPDEIFNRVMNQIDVDQRAGRLDVDAAKEARGRAQENLQAGMDRLRDEGRALQEALRTPQEKLQAELARIAQLQKAGAIDQNVADRAEAKAREDFAQTQAKEIDQTIEQEKALGPTGTFSGFAVGSGAFGGNFSYEKQSLDIMKKNLEEAKKTAKNTRQRMIARAG